jgi:hypothetical protein
MTKEIAVEYQDRRLFNIENGNSLSYYDAVSAVIEGKNQIVGVVGKVGTRIYDSERYKKRLKQIFSDFSQINLASFKLGTINEKHATELLTWMGVEISPKDFEVIVTLSDDSLKGLHTHTNNSFLEKTVNIGKRKIYIGFRSSLKDIDYPDITTLTSTENPEIKEKGYDIAFIINLSNQCYELLSTSDERCVGNRHDLLGGKLIIQVDNIKAAKMRSLEYGNKLLTPPCPDAGGE